MGHWKRLIKISGGTDYYYCIKNMTCLIHACYCSVVLVIIFDIPSIIMSQVYLVTLPDTCYIYVVTPYSCTCILCIPCILFHVSLQILLLYNHNTVVWLFCILHIYMFIFITTPLCYNYS